MVSKISPIGPSSGVDAAKGLEALDKAASADEAAVVNDSVTQVALALMDGQISKDEAVGRIISETMQLPMVNDAPPQLKAEVEKMLTTAIETDPQLRALVSALD